MANDLPKGKYVSLSEALSWIAFGDACGAKELNKKMLGQAFGLPYRDTKQRLQKAVSMLSDEALKGKFDLLGKYITSQKDADAAVTEIIATFKLRDFKQYDITVDGLLFGSGLAWLPDESSSWTVTAPKRLEAFIEVIAQRSDLKRVFSAGCVATIGTDKQVLPPLGQAALKAWYDNLTPDEKGLSEAGLTALAGITFPLNSITRVRIRQFTLGRPRGRKPNSR